MRTFHSIVMIGLMMLAASCQSPPRQATLERVATLYSEGLDASAASTATMIVRRGGIDAKTAAWYGGLAEYRLGHMAAARSFFNTAATSHDAAVAGGAQSMLAQIATNRADTDAALDHYDVAWNKLRGSDRRQVALHAIAAAQAAKDSQATNRWTRRLAGQPTVASSDTSPFALQAGAYRSRSGAEKRASTLRRTHDRTLSPIVVRGRSNDAGTWWLVQCGGYATQSTATAARRSLGTEEFIVVRTATASSP